MLRLRIYSPLAPPGQAEISLRGMVRRPSEDPKGLSITLVDGETVSVDELQRFLRTMSSGLRPPPAYAGFDAAPR
jgi:hypothetical protein